MPLGIIGFNQGIFLDADCPIWEDGYHFVQDKCYYLDHTRRESDGYWAKYTYNKASETCAEKFKNGGRLFEPKDEQTNNIVFKTIKKANDEAGYAYPGEMFLGIVADTYTDSHGTLKVTGKGPSITSYRSRALKSRGS